MLRGILIVAAAVILISAGLGFFIRRKCFRPNPDKAEQQKQLNDDLRAAGFAYDYTGDYFYSLKNCWQRTAGYCRLYDEGAPFFNMIMDCEPIPFSYAGKRWLIELWKGQYGITTGAEIGVYNTAAGDIRSERFTGTFYEPISDEEQLGLSFVLMKNGKKLLARKARHWWLTAFRLGEFSEKNELEMRAKIKFPSQEMCRAFTDALGQIGYAKKEFSVRSRTVQIRYTTPHTPQPSFGEEIQEAAVQRINQTNCAIYRNAASQYPDTLDRLEYFKSSVPELYRFMLRSLYGKEFFKAFEWLIDLIRGHNPPDKPPCVPPEPPCSPPEPPREPCSCAQNICRQHCERLSRDHSTAGRCVRKGIR